VVPVVAVPPSGRFRCPPDLGDLDEEEEAGTSCCGRFTTSGAAMMLDDFVRYVVCTGRSVPFDRWRVSPLFWNRNRTEPGRSQVLSSIEIVELKGINEEREMDRDRDRDRESQ
jgi:hypothetical protein